MNTEMTDEQMRVAIATHAGWTKIGPKGFGEKMLVGASPKDRAWPFSPLSDYFGDLNAMHEAEKTLTIAQRGWFWSFLVQETGADQGKCEPIFPTEGFKMTHATARQRAIAFLRAVGKGDA